MLVIPAMINFSYAVVPKVDRFLLVSLYQPNLRKPREVTDILNDN